MLFIYISIAILLFVTAIHVTLHIFHWKHFQEMKKKYKTQLADLRILTEKQVNFLDLSEFKALDPYMKDAYKKYIVDLAFPIILTKLNTLGKDINVENIIKENDALITETIKQTLEGIDFKSLLAQQTAPTTSS